MIQTHMPHALGTLSPCRGCGRAPMHWLCRGTTNREAALGITAGTRHQVECQRCDRRTTRHASAIGAFAEWDNVHGRPDSTAHPWRRGALK